MTESRWYPSREAALARLHAFLPRAGGAYARMRNFDFGPEDRSNVSGLSPYIRCRALSEKEVVQRVLQHHTPEAAQKFIQEVCWRTYWKGWLEMRPQVWRQYLEDVKALLETDSQSDAYKRAVAGDTHLKDFNVFARELVETHYLHNHARMWFASIWIFTLGLPWQLGADFFLRHLLDGDPASNTLSWRWVAGLQTRGKNYVATAGNMQKYTAGRLGNHIHLAQKPAPITDSHDLPAPQRLPENDLPPSGRFGILLHEDDVCADMWLCPDKKPASAAICFPRALYATHSIDAEVQAFRQALLEDAAGRLERNGIRVTRLYADIVQGVPAWVETEKLDAVLMARPFVGFWDHLIDAVRAKVKDDIPIRQVRCDWDQQLHPHATHGYFRFRKQLPKLIKRMQS